MNISQVALGFTCDLTVDTCCCAFQQDVQWNDLDYADKRRVFTFDPQRFGDLPEMVEEFHQRGMKYVLILVSCSPNSPNHSNPI